RQTHGLAAHHQIARAGRIEAARGEDIIHLDEGQSRKDIEAVDADARGHVPASVSTSAALMPPKPKAVLRMDPTGIVCPSPPAKRTPSRTGCSSPAFPCTIRPCRARTAITVSATPADARP